jgi:hypothetical protein
MSLITSSISTLSKLRMIMYCGGVVDTDLGDDGLPYLTLAYNNGPGFYNHRNVTNSHRLNLTTVNTG